MEYLANVKPLEDAGKTDAEIVAVLQANPLTHENICATASDTNGHDQTESVLYLLTAKFLVLRMAKDQTWQGSLVDLGDQDPQVSSALGILFPYLQVQNSIIHSSTDLQSATLLEFITNAVAGLVEADATPRTGQDVHDAVNAITGGKIYAGVTEQMIADMRSDHVDDQRVAELEALKAEIDNDFIAPHEAKGGDDAATVRARIKADL